MPIIARNTPSPTEPIADLLSPFGELLERLREQEGVTGRDFDRLNTAEPDQQLPTEYTVPFFVPHVSSMAEMAHASLEFYRAVMSGHTRVHMWFDEAKFGMHLLADTHALCRQPGVHRVVVDLCSPWHAPVDPRDRGIGVTRSTTRAGFEVMAAYALSSPELLRRQDGVTLPYCDLGIAAYHYKESANPLAAHFWHASLNHGVNVVVREWEEPLSRRWIKPTVTYQA